ncbi:hypothetical protein Leryth_021345 [Lithospermum erythrorhizon]|nr:hypothetical protein Leryth_021345 [Lithospermum erythrorhizon]
MSEQVRIVQYNNNMSRDEERVMEWEDGLPCLDDLTPLSQALIPAELATAFRITAEQPRTVVEVNRASKNTIRSIRGQLDLNMEEYNNNNNNNDDDVGSGKCSKRPRLVWTPQLHKRFVEVVGHLGIKNAVPKTIMQLMNVEGLTRENVASHLQKYRLYLKRMQGLSDEGPSASDHLYIGFMGHQFNMMQPHYHNHN